MQGSPLFRQAGGAITLKPFVFITECVQDERGSGGEPGPTRVRAEVGSLHIVGGQSAGLFFGVHVLCKNPLHTFKKS